MRLLLLLRGRPDIDQAERRNRTGTFQRREHLVLPNPYFPELANPNLYEVSR